MNERIRQLTEQAISDVDYIRDDPVLDQELSEMFIPDVFAKRFAEMIIKECIDICNQAILQNQDTLSKLSDNELAEKMVIHGSIYQAQKLGNGIKEHFGVEE